jgi:hypothetical protein
MDGHSHSSIFGRSGLSCKKGRGRREGGKGEGHHGLMWSVPWGGYPQVPVLMELGDHFPSMRVPRYPSHGWCLVPKYQVEGRRARGQRGMG